MTNDLEDLNDTYPGAGTFQFGADQASNDKQLALVRGKSKAAMCAAASDFADDPKSMPKVGRADIAVEWDGSPALVIRTTKVQTVTFENVTADMARADGIEAGRDTLDAWRKLRMAEFKAEGAFTPKMELVFEHFEMVEDLKHR
ncbi:MAG: ASCH domain-containing protein [Planktomarina sp.]